MSGVGLARVTWFLLCLEWSLAEPYSRPIAILPNDSYTLPGRGFFVSFSFSLSYDYGRDLRDLLLDRLYSVTHHPDGSYTVCRV